MTASWYADRLENVFTFCVSTHECLFTLEHKQLIETDLIFILHNIQDLLILASFNNHDSLLVNTC